MLDYCNTTIKSIFENKRVKKEAHSALRKITPTTYIKAKHTLGPRRVTDRDKLTLTSIVKALGNNQLVVSCP